MCWDTDSCNTMVVNGVLKFWSQVISMVGGAVASWLVRSTPEQVVQVRALCTVVFLGKSHFTLTVPLSTQVYKWVPANLMLGGNPVMDLASHPGRGGSRKTLSCFML